MWSLLGARGVEVLAWESFGYRWALDIQNQLKLRNSRVIRAEYGELPNLSNVDFTSDVIFTWNGTTSGVRVPDGEWISADRTGLTIVDATSALFSMYLPWDKIDVATWSWQKALGGEAAHGMIALSPRALERLKIYVPPWPLPRLFCLINDGKINEKIFEGETINTPSMLAVEDVLDALNWAKRVGGLQSLVSRTNQNAQALKKWVNRTPWIKYLCADNQARSPTSVVLVIIDPRYLRLNETVQRSLIKRLSEILASENVAFDIMSHRHAPPGLRIWCGSTIDVENLKILFPWLDWAFSEIMKPYQ